MSPRKNPRVDVVVVGAGLSGLAAARRLVDGGRTVAVLEAKSRVGGRTCNRNAGGAPVDEGATLIYPQHRNVIRLAEAHDVELFETRFDGRFLFYSEGTAHAFRFGKLRGMKLLGNPALQPLLQVALALTARLRELPMPPEALLEVIGAINRLDELAATVPAHAPWTAPHAAELDNRTLGCWVADEVASRQARRLFESSLAGYLPPSTSLLYALHFLNTWGGVGSLLAGQARIFRFTGGAQALATALAESIVDRVILACPVREITWQPEGVVVRGGETEFQAEHVIVAVTPSGLRNVRFDPELPADRTALHDSWQPVHGRKINVVYDEPFWRQAGLSGSALADLGAVPGVIDVSPPSGEVGILATYVTVDEAEEDPAVRRRVVLAAFADMFGPRALEPRAYVEKNWAEEPFTYGCEGGLTTGALTTARRLMKTPVGRVHWAGVETADAWMGFMNGAVQAGERAADEVLAVSAVS